MLFTQMIQDGDEQALRIPQRLRTDRTEYCINRIGDTFLAYPAEDPWAPVRQVIGTFPQDFMSDRAQPTWSDNPLWYKR